MYWGKHYYGSNHWASNYWGKLPVPSGSGAGIAFGRESNLTRRNPRRKKLADAFNRYLLRKQVTDVLELTAIQMDDEEMLMLLMADE